MLVLVTFIVVVVVVVIVLLVLEVFNGRLTYSDNGRHESSSVTQKLPPQW